LPAFQAPTSHPYWSSPDTVNLGLKNYIKWGELSCSLFLHWKIWKVICCKTCEILVHIATTIGKLQHLEYLKLAFLDTCRWAIRLVFPETATNKIENLQNIISAHKGWEAGAEVGQGSCTSKWGLKSIDKIIGLH